MHAALPLDRVTEATWLSHLVLARRVARGETTTLILDCAGARGASLKGLARLQAIARALAARGGRLVMHEVSPEFAAVVDLVGLTETADLVAARRVRRPVPAFRAVAAPATALPVAA